MNKTNFELLAECILTSQDDTASYGLAYRLSKRTNMVGMHCQCTATF